MAGVEQQTAEVVAKSAQYGGASGSLAGTLWAAMADNAVQFGLLFALVSMICTAIGTIWIVKHKKLQIELNRAQLEALTRDK